MSSPKQKIILIFLFFIILALGYVIAVKGSIFPSQKSKTDKIKIVTTLFPLYDFAKNIGQDKVDVLLLLPPGVEAHSFEPKPNDVIYIDQADIFIYTGSQMEPWVSGLISAIDNKKLTVVDASQNISLLSNDPHIWLDMSNAKTMVNNITESLISKDPGNSQFYKTNAQAYQQKLDQVDQSYFDLIKNCQSKEIVYAGHYAFGYLVSRYGLKYTSAQGVAPDSEPTASDLIGLVNQIKQNNIKYLYYEELSSPKIANIISSETQSKLLFLNAAHNISKDQFNQGTSFITIMEDNLSSLKTGLDCK